MAILFSPTGFAFASPVVNGSESASPVKITGKVTDDKGAPMPGVSVVVKGTTTGILTDIEGNYTLNVPDSKNSVVFSFVGYIAQEIVVGTQTTINVKLAENVVNIEQVVVVGYGKINKKDITGAVSSIAASEMNKGVYSSPAQMLQGKVPGLNITRSGDPTASPS
ncbi:MAG: carboxypeptidase-like regulatory domain-containing protein, partial [Mariniphaga sp.]